MKNKTFARVLMVLAAVPSLLMAQDASASNPAAVARTPNNKYVVAYPSSTRTWKTGSGQTTSTAISQAVVDDLVKKLAQKQFVRVQTLDGQCCTVQLELLNVAPREMKKTELTLSAKVTLLDVDKQSVYTKDFQTESAATTQAGKNQVNSAAAGLVNSILADSKLMQILAGK